MILSISIKIITGFAVVFAVGVIPGVAGIITLKRKRIITVNLFY